jgi:hypothetical protein
VYTCDLYSCPHISIYIYIYIYTYMHVIEIKITGVHHLFINVPSRPHT